MSEFIEGFKSFFEVSDSQLYAYGEATAFLATGLALLFVSIALAGLLIICTHKKPGTEPHKNCEYGC